MYGLSKSMLTLWQCSFIAPVTRRSGDGGGKYAFNTTWYAFNLAVLGVLLTGVVWAVMDDLRASQLGLSLRMQNTSSGVVTVLQAFLLTVVCVLPVTCSASRHRTLSDIGLQLRRVDAALGTPRADQQVVVQFAVCLVGLHVVLFAMDGYLWYSFTPISWMYFVCYVYLFIDLAAMLMYAQIAWSIGHRFQNVNDAIERKLAGFQKTFGTAATGYGRPVQRARKFAESTVQVSCADVPAADAYYYDTNVTADVSFLKLQELHWSLCDSIKMVNDKFGWQLLVEMFLNCVELIITPYFIIMDLFFPVVYGSTDIKFISIQVVWVLTHISRLLLIVLPTSYASKKGEKTAVIICKYLTIDIEPNDMKQLEIFVLQLQKYTLDFSACGIINLHRTTITTIIGTALTYLVILVQFQNTN